MSATYYCDLCGQSHLVESECKASMEDRLRAQVAALEAECDWLRGMVAEVREEHATSSMGCVGDYRCAWCITADAALGDAP